MTQTTEQLLKVLFYKIYTTPRRYTSNVRFIFALKEMMGFDDDEFRRLCDELDEEALRDDMPQVLMRSLETMEQALDNRPAKEAIDDLEARPRTHLKVADLYRLAGLYLDRGDAPMATEILREALAVDGGRGEFWLCLADAHLIAGRREDARAVLQEATSRCGRVSIEPAIIEERLDALNLDVADDIYVREIFCRCYLQTGDVLFAEERWQDALEQYEQALRVVPGNYEYMLKLASCHWRLGNKEKAIHFIHQSLIIMEMPVLVSF